MKMSFSSLLLLASILIAADATAQVTPDGTTNTTVDVNGNDFTINQGDRAGSNLFHSFQDFSVPNGGLAFFNNALDIANILSRVTGGNISNIDGLIRANGSANLFLLNPTGIIFGPGASLDIGGSFLGSTAASLLFPDGEFSAVDLDNPPLLTINAPIGLGFRDEPGDIAITGDNANQTFLEVNPGQNLTLVGGDINFDTGIIFAPGGSVELGGLSAAGVVGINENGSLSFPDGIDRADISFTNSDIFVNSDGGGFININARNLDLTGESLFFAGISSGLGSPGAVAGDITINATDNISLDRSEIANIVESLGQGKGGDININANSVTLSNGSALSSDTDPEAEGDAGNIIINATESISLSGVNSDERPSGIFARVRQGATGMGGNVELTTETLSLDEGNQQVGTQIVTDTQGEGDAGDITIDAINIMIDGIESGIRSAVQETGIGNAGNIIITADSLSLNNEADINTPTFGLGDAGNIEIDANSVAINGGSEIRSDTRGQGNGGNIIINASDGISVDGIPSINFQYKFNLNW